RTISARARGARSGDASLLPTARVRWFAARPWLRCAMRSPEAPWTRTRSSSAARTARASIPCRAFARSRTTTARAASTAAASIASGSRLSTDRYARHRAIAGFSQETLQASRFAVIGAGAIGNEVVKNLCLLGVGAIDVYDFDTVEVHNLTRSVLLREADVGTGKATAVARRAQEMDPGVAVRA